MHHGRFWRELTLTGTIESGVSVNPKFLVALDESFGEDCEHSLAKDKRVQSHSEECLSCTLYRPVSPVDLAGFGRERHVPSVSCTNVFLVLHGS